MNKIQLKTFLYHFCNNIREDKKYCFILGSGASKSSGIPTGGELVKKWMEELGELYPSRDLEEWITHENISLMILSILFSSCGSSSSTTSVSYRKPTSARCSLQDPSYPFVTSG